MIFCHVIKVIPAIMLIERITHGNHVCNGTLPAFIKRAALDKIFE